MVDFHAAREQLCDLLDREIEYAQDLAAILTREQHALTNRDAASLDKLVEQKKARVEAIDELDARCKELLQSWGFTTDREGLEACLHRCDRHGTLAERWTVLAERLRHCALQNRTNGSLLELNHRAITRLLDALGTQTSHEQLYGPKGQAIENASPRPLARA